MNNDNYESACCRRRVGAKKESLVAITQVITLGAIKDDKSDGVFRFKKMLT